MAIEEAPAFQFYVKEWRSSRPVMRMTFAQRGMYLELLLEQWENLTLPDSAAAVAVLIGGSETEWVKAWPVLRRNFVTVDGQPGRIHNLRLERVRAERRTFKGGQPTASRAGGVARAQTAVRGANGRFGPSTEDQQSTSTLVPATTPADTSAGAPALPAPPASSSSSSSSSSSAREITRPLAPAERFMDTYREGWKRLYGFECSLILTPLQFADLEQQLSGVPGSQLSAALDAYFASSDPYVLRAKHPLQLFLKNPTAYLADETRPSLGRSNTRLAAAVANIKREGV